MKISCVLALFLIGISAGAQIPSHELAASYGKLPLSFEPNRGQADARAQFISRGAGYTIFLNPTSATFGLQRTAAAPRPFLPNQQPSILESAIVRMDLIGGSPKITMQPQEKLPGIVNYLMGGTSTKWSTGLPTYAKTRSPNVYPGIDLVYYGTQGQLEYDFILAPKADASRIRLRFAGATPAVEVSGDLVLSLTTENGQKQDGENDVRFHKPVVYQQAEGIREPVNGKFTIAANHEVGFQIGPYDHNRELIIDPTLVYSSYLGGSSQQSIINGMAVNATGQIYVTGGTYALDFPTTTGVIQKSCPAPVTPQTKCGPSSLSAAFVSKISADGQSLIYSTYLGGSGADYGTSVAVDASDDAWVLGGTNSVNFPITADAIQTFCSPTSNDFNFQTGMSEGEKSGCTNGPTSLFIAKLNPTGSHILYGTFLGGTQGETPAGIALDAKGNIYVSGTAATLNNLPLGQGGQYNYPTTASAYQATGFSGDLGLSAFVTELSPDGHSLLYSSFLSATAGQTIGSAMSVGAGKIFIGGYTQTNTLATTPGALSRTCPANATACANNGFVAEFDPTKSGVASLVFSTYLNGQHASTSGLAEDTSMVTALAADATGNVYAVGSTRYPDFPTTSGVLQPTCPTANFDFCEVGFVTKLSSTGALVWSTFYGSPSASGQYGVFAVAVDASNNVYITGQADGAGDLPTKNGFQSYTSGVAYVTELSPNGSQVLFGSFYGGGSTVNPTAIAVDAANNIYLAGYGGIVPLVKPFQSTAAGGFSEGFFAKINLGPLPPAAPVITSSPANPTIQTSASFNFSDTQANVTFICSLDQASFTACTSPQNYSGVSLGSHTFSVEVMDSSGTASAATNFTWIISTTVCAYQLNPGGQAFPAQGGIGTVTITAGAGCTWTVGSTPANISLTGPASGAGSGTVAFVVLPNSGGDLSGSFTIAGQSFTVEQVAATGSIAGLAGVGSLAQVNSQGGWNFELDAVNLGNSAATARINFTDPIGNPLIMPLTFPQSSTTALPELAATLDRTINPNARIVIDSSGPATSNALLGSGQLLSNGSVSGFGIFSYPAFNWNAVVPLETRRGSTYSLPFDNTGMLTTGVALSNITASATSVKVTILSDAGVPIGSDTLIFTPQAFQQFLLPTKYPQTAAARGTIQFQTTSPSQVSVLGVRANGTAALTTLPVLSNVDLPGGSISDLTYGGGFTSTFYLVNTGTASASLMLSFYDQSGAPVSLPLSLPQTTSTQTTQALTQTLAPGQMLEVATQASAALLANVSGSAQLTTTGSIGGFEIFDFLPNGQEASVPLETRTPKNFVLVYDNTNGLSTGVALANNSAAAANIAANIFDDQGNLLQSTTISLAGRAQQTIVLNTAYTVTANKRGMVQFVVPPSGPISMIGIRVGTVGAVTITTIPILTQ